MLAQHSWLVRQKICARGAISEEGEGGGGGSGVRDMASLSLGNLGAKFSKSHSKTLRKLALLSLDNDLKHFIIKNLLCLQCSLSKMHGPL